MPTIGAFRVIFESVPMLDRFLILLCFSLAGCSGSRWAREDPVYAAKYSEHSDDLLKMAKQSIDARHVAGRSGYRFAADYGEDPSTVVAGIGAFKFPSAWSEYYGALDAVAGTESKWLFGGAEAGVRIHSPSRLSPFVGVGGQIGIDSTELLFRDDDEDGFFEDGDDEARVYGALLPEAGLHFWLTAKTRVTASARYSLSAAANGENNQQWLFGISVSKLHGEHDRYAEEEIIFD